ncbi:MAG: ABC transporter substrate-binding protein [Xanthobacteraceae bacterium]|jgi:putative ABC transport system substrate-binding protein
MRRRDFIKAIVGSTAWPLAALAQQPAMPVVGFLNVATAARYVPFAAAFRRGLSEAGYVEGQNVSIEYRWADDHYDRLPTLVDELIRHQVAVIAATGTPAALAAKEATSTIPIVFTAAVDPVAVGLVTSLSRPSGNLTGVSQLQSALGAKRLELLRELVPNPAVIGVLVNPNYPGAESERKDVTEAARIIGQQVHIVNVGSESDFDGAFATLVQLKASALLVTTDILFLSRRDHIVALAARHKIPAIYFERQLVLAGGLMSYAPDLSEGYRQGGIYVGRILKGTKPSELPVVQPTKLEFVINLKTARALGLEIPPKLLALADEVIE